MISILIKIEGTSREVSVRSYHSRSEGVNKWTM